MSYLSFSLKKCSTHTHKKIAICGFVRENECMTKMNSVFISLWSVSWFKNDPMIPFPVYTKEAVHELKYDFANRLFAVVRDIIIKSLEVVKWKAHGSR